MVNRIVSLIKGCRHLLLDQGLRRLNILEKEGENALEGLVNAPSKWDNNPQPDGGKNELFDGFHASLSVR